MNYAIIIKNLFMKRQNIIEIPLRVTTEKHCIYKFFNESFLQTIFFSTTKSLTISNGSYHGANTDIPNIAGTS